MGIKGKWKTQKPVLCKELNLEFESISKAFCYMNKNGYMPEGKRAKHHMKKYISKCCKGETKTAYGFHWEFIEDNSTMQQVFIEFVIPNMVYGKYKKILQAFGKKISALHGLTYDSFQVREFTVDEIPF